MNIEIQNRERDDRAKARNARRDRDQMKIHVETAIKHDANDATEIDEDSWDRFVHPWNYENRYVPEIPMKDIKICSYVGSGKKGSTSIAMWNGTKVALKQWTSYSGYPTGPYSEWEILNYRRLKSLQGKLIPKLLFVTRNDSGRRAIGLELGRPIDKDDKTETELKAFNKESIAKHGWMQRKGSIRCNNFVYMNDNENKERLVAIDLESFIPNFLFSHNSSPTISYAPVLGIPIVEPTEVKIAGCTFSWEWSVACSTSDFNWREEKKSIFGPTDAELGDKRVSLYLYSVERDMSALKLILERNALLKSEQETLVATPLFLTRERDGDVLVGYEPVDSWISKQEVEHLFEGLTSLGWSIKDEGKRGLLFVMEKASVERESDGKILLRDLTILNPPSDPPSLQKVSSDKALKPSLRKVSSDEASQGTCGEKRDLSVSSDEVPTDGRLQKCRVRGP